MEFTKEDLDYIIRTQLGDFAIYELKNGELQTIYAAPSLARYSGMTRAEYDEITVHDASDIIMESDIPRVGRALEHAMKDPDRDIEITYRIRHKSNGFGWVTAKARVIGTRDGCPVLISVFFNFSFEEQEHSLLLDNSAANIYVIDYSTYEILFMNRPAREQFRINDYYGHTCYDMLCSESETCSWCLIPKMKEGRVHVDECYYPPHDRWYRLDGYEVNWFGRKAVVVYSLDITEQKIQQLQLKSSELNEHGVRLAYEAVINAAHLFVFEYAVRWHTIVLMENEYTLKCSEDLGIPHEIGNVPDAFKEFLDEKNASVLKAMHDEIDGGNPYTECIVTAKIPGRSDALLLRVSYTTVFDSSGKPEKAYGMAQNISRRMAAGDKEK